MPWWGWVFLVIAGLLIFSWAATRAIWFSRSEDDDDGDGDGTRR